MEDTSKGFFCFTFDRKCPYWHNVISQKRRATQQKQLQGNVFLLNRSTHAKIETTLMENKEPKIGHKVDMHTGLQLYCSYINGHPY